LSEVVDDEPQRMTALLLQSCVVVREIDLLVLWTVITTASMAIHITKATSKVMITFRLVIIVCFSSIISPLSAIYNPLTSSILFLTAIIKIVNVFS
jgi:hypothetical protein